MLQPRIVILTAREQQLVEGAVKQIRTLARELADHHGFRITQVNMTWDGMRMSGGNFKLLDAPGSDADAAKKIKQSDVGG